MMSNVGLEMSSCPRASRRTVVRASEHAIVPRRVHARDEPASNETSRTEAVTHSGRGAVARHALAARAALPHDSAQAVPRRHPDNTHRHRSRVTSVPRGSLTVSIGVANDHHGTSINELM